MHSFRFHKEQEEQKIEEVIKYRKHKIFKQQFFYAIVLGVILLFVGVWIYNKIFYTTFDGYVKIDVNRQRALDDIFIKDIYVQTGDYVLPGDTLYSYFYIDGLVGYHNRSNEPNVISQDRDLHIKISTLREAVQVLRVRVAELQKQIATEDHNIGFGLSSNSHKLDLERELKTAREELRMKLATLATVSDARQWVAGNAREARSLQKDPILLQDIIVDTTGIYNNMLNYRLSTDTALVATMQAPDGSVVFYTEEVMTLRSVDIVRSNFMIYAYVPADEVSKLKRNKKFVVYFNDDVKAEAEMGLIGVRVESLPQELRSNFSRYSKVVIVQFNLKAGQRLPLWAYTNELPVRIEMTNYNLNMESESEHETFKVWIETGAGLGEQSREYLKYNRLEHMRKNQMRLRHRNPLQNQRYHKQLEVAEKPDTTTTD